MLDDPIDFIAAHGIVLESAAGPVPTLAHAVAGEKIRGSWWSHPKASTIYAVTREVRGSSAVLTCRVVHGKVTLVHRRLWPALVRLAPELDSAHLAAVLEIHTDSGKHQVRTTPYPHWVPVEVQSAARGLSREEAIRMLGDWVLRPPRGSKDKT